MLISVDFWKSMYGYAMDSRTWVDVLLRFDSPIRRLSYLEAFMIGMSQTDEE